MGLIKKLKYPQPHSIKVPIFVYTNETLRQREIEYLHARAKYEAKYQLSKQNKRLK